jgi:hypothetical protein
MNIINAIINWINKIFRGSGFKTKEQEINDKIIEGADFKLALQVANDGKASREVIKKKFCAELLNRLQELDKPCDNHHDAYGKDRIIRQIEDIIEMMGKYNMRPSYHIDRTLNYILSYDIVMSWELRKLASKDMKERMVRVFLARGSYEQARLAKGKGLSAEEKKGLLKRIKENDFEKPLELLPQK